MCITAIIPALNNGGAIAPLAAALKEAGVQRIVVVDRRSTDGTIEEAERLDLSVVRLNGASRGYAVREVLMAVDTPYVLVMSPEALLPPQDIKRLLSHLRYYDIAVAACRGGARRLASWLIRASSGARAGDPLA